MKLQNYIYELNLPELQKDFCRRIFLCREALKLFSKIENPELWGDLNNDLGNSLRICSNSNLDSEKREAVTAHKAALEVFIRERYPIKWAHTQNSLGLALMELKNDISSDLEAKIPEFNNIELAIDAFKKALEVRTFSEFPFEWAHTQINLGNALEERRVGIKKENLQDSINAFEKVLSKTKCTNDFSKVREAATKNLERVQKKLASRIRLEEERIALKESMRDETRLNVFNVFDLLKTGKFLRYQECDYLKKTSDSEIVIMVSHRWNSISTPDTDGIQFHGVIRFVIQVCMMAMHSTPNVFNNVDFSEIITPKSFDKQIELLYEEYKDRLNIDPIKVVQECVDNIKLLLEYLDNTIGRINSQLVLIDLGALAYMMNRIDIWYDFTSMPQKPRTEIEEKIFKSELDRLDSYFKKFYSLIIWSKKDTKRAWCFLEAYLSQDHHSIFSCEKSLESSEQPASIYEWSHGTKGSIDIIEFLLSNSSNSAEKGREFLERMLFDSKNALLSQDVILASMGRKRSEGNDLSKDLSIHLSKFLDKTIREIL